MKRAILSACVLTGVVLFNTVGFAQTRGMTRSSVYFAHVPIQAVDRTGQPVVDPKRNREVVTEEVHREPAEPDGERSRRFLKDHQIADLAEDGQEVLGHQFLGAEEIEILRPPVSEVQRERRPLGEVEGPDLGDPAQ